MSYPARIRTWTKRTKISCATVTLPGIASVQTPKSCRPRKSREILLTSFDLHKLARLSPGGYNRGRGNPHVSMSQVPGDPSDIGQAAAGKNPAVSPVRVYL